METDDPNLLPWRIIPEDSWNYRHRPWTDGVGIETIQDNVTPSCVCWFTRGWGSQKAAEYIVWQHNANLVAYEIASRKDE
jgi:hypothetical protein